MPTTILKISITVWKFEWNLQFYQCDWDRRNRGPSSSAEQLVHDDCDNDEDEVAHICEINGNDQNRLCKARAAHDLVLRRADVLLAKKSLSATAALHSRTHKLITKLDDVEKVVDLDVPTILQEQLKDTVLNAVRSWIQGGISLYLKGPEIRQSKVCSDTVKSQIDYS